MKRILSAIFAIALPLVCAAEKVDKEKAVRTAENFFRMGGSGSVSVQLVRSTGDYYVFNNASGGFVIISAEDTTVPVLAYSYEGSIDPEDSSPALKARLDLYGKDIRKARSIQASKEVRMDWENLSVQTKAGVKFNPVVELQTAKWNQGAPYNGQCPIVDGGRSVTGCGPTATAIVMRFYKWPQRGKGRIPDYDYTSNSGKSVHITGYELGHEYDWDNMPMTTGEFKTKQQKDAVATLMKDLGYMENAMYNPGGTSIYSFSYLNVIPFMDYSVGASYLGSWYLPAADFVSAVEDELLAGRPVLMSGANEESGHAFVADGFDDGHRIRFNWGWGGSGDGYYTLAPYIYKNAKANEYPEGIDMIAGFIPGADSPTDNGVISWSESPIKQLRIPEGIVPQKGMEFTVALTSWRWAGGYLSPRTDLDEESAILYTKSSGVYGGATLRFALVSSDGSLKEFISDPFSSWVLSGVSCMISVDIEPGDSIRPYYVDESGQWCPVAFDQSLGNAIISLGESASLKEVLSLRVDKRVHEDSRTGENVKVMELTLKDNTGVWLVSETGSLVSGCGITGSKPTAVRYSKDWHKANIYLSELKGGTYRVVLKRPLDDAYFEFIVK